MSLSLDQISTLVIIERTTASVSVIATLTLIGTYCFFKEFRSLSNTLIFYASFANLFANVACLMGRDFISNPNGAACQFQAFLLEMFMQSDPLWSCAMAINVYLCIFKRFDTVQLRRLHWIYALFCYGLPFIPAMFCLFYRERQRGKMYGNATLWCWIKNDYSDVRIWSYYLPIWISIVVSLSIYFRVGIVIYRVRADIRRLENESDNCTVGGFVIPEDELPYVPRDDHFATPVEKKIESESETTDQSIEADKPTAVEEEDAIGYGISKWDSIDNDVLSYPAAVHQCNGTLTPQYEEMSSSPRSPGSPTFPRSPFHASFSSTFPTSPLDPTYTHPSRLSRPSISSFSPSINQLNTTPTRSTHKMDKIKWAYTKSALLFTVSILITWIPASINRAQGFRRPHNPVYVLNVMSAFVLPLQGFWNTVIFFVGSWNVVKRSWRRWRRRRAARRALTRRGSQAGLTR